MAISMPTKKPQPVDNSGSQLLRGILQVGGTVAGGIFGGPAGAAAGGAAGSTVGGLLAPDKAPEPVDPGPGAIQSQQSPDIMQQRLQQMNNDPSSQLLTAQSAIQNLPPDMQAQYKPVIDQALSMSKQRRV